MNPRCRILRIRVRRTWPVLALLVIAAILPLLATDVASAHAEPDEVRPGDGAVVTTVPEQVEIVMSQELARREGGSDIDVIGPDGTEVTTQAATLDLQDRTRLTVPLPTDLAPGTYTVRWKSLSSEDGDPADGELSFTYDPNGQPSPGREQLDDAESPGSGVATPAANDGASGFSDGGSSSGSTWVVAAAAGIAGLVIGGAVTFLLVQRQSRLVA